MLLLLFGTTSASVHTQDHWSVAADEIVRLAPTVFEKVPPAIRKALSDQGCSIPQTWGNDRPHNVVSGEFAAQGQTDWAALCSRHARSTIVVFWGGPARCPPLTVSRPDRTFLQYTGPADGILFSRGLSPVPASALARYPVSDERPDELSHDAISDGFLDKGATAYYCHDGRWSEFVVD